MSTRMVKVNPRGHHRPYQQYKLKTRSTYEATNRNIAITMSITEKVK
jgi:hypothetical protein